jgi:hypothetical protein
VPTLRQGITTSAHAVTGLAVMVAATNPVVEPGLTILVLPGWEFLVAALVAGCYSSP